MRLCSLRKPSIDSLRVFLAHQATLGLSFPFVGATAKSPPSGYTVDRTRVQLGNGAAVFQAAKAALRRWEQFQLKWVEAWSPDTPLETGRVVAVMGCVMGLWWLNSCQIVYTVDETGPLSRFGFAYGTLPGHIERGEERFLIEWDQATNEVTYDILAFSRPDRFLTWLGYPLVRRWQKRFGRDSAASMFRAIHATIPVPTIHQSTG